VEKSTRLRYSANFLPQSSANLSPCPSPVDGLQDGDQGGKAPPTVREEEVRDQLRNMNIRESMGPEEMHPRVLRELADIIATSLSMIFVRSGTGCPER